MPPVDTHKDTSTPHPGRDEGRPYALGYRSAGVALLLVVALAWGWFALHFLAGAPVAEAGGIIAAPLLSSLGLALPLLLVPLALWGWQMAMGRGVALGLRRLLFWPLGGLALSAVLAGIAPPSGWSYGAGLGGALGDAVRGSLYLGAGLLGMGELVAALITRLLLPVFGFWALARVALVPTPRLSAAQPTLVAATPRQENVQVSQAAAADAPRPTPNTEVAQPAPPLPFPTANGVPAAAVIAPAATANGAGSQPTTMLERAADPYMVFARESDPEPDTAGTRIVEPDRTRQETHARDEARRDAGSQPDVASSPGHNHHAASPLNGEPDAPAPTFGLVADDGYAFPPLSMLKSEPLSGNASGLSEEDLDRMARLLESVLADFGIQGTVIGYQPGPVVTLYEFEPARGVKSARVINLADDIARSMSAISARVAVIPGRNVIGIELSNAKRRIVYLRDILESDKMKRTRARLPLALGTNIGGGGVVADLARMPHLLIAGTTGSGKSVGINTMICSLLYRMHPDKCKFIMIDPKMLELSAYDGIPHLLTPVVTDPKKAVRALKWTVREMEQRYLKMSKLGVRNIDSFNARIREARAKGEVIRRKVQTGFDKEKGQPIYENEELKLDELPYIVVVVDEMADLMMVAGKDIEAAVQRLAQMARAAGIHLIAATQRPSVDVITGTIKANFPTRISFQVTSRIDSRTILGEQGAEQLLGQGDMLYMAGGGRITRVHGPFVSEDEVERIAEHLKRQGVPQYLSSVTEEDVLPADKAAKPSKEDANAALYAEAVAIVLRDRKASTSYIQRRLSIGYNRAAMLIERMEEEGIISAANHAGKREVLADFQALAAESDPGMANGEPTHPETSGMPPQEDVETVH